MKEGLNAAMDKAKSYIVPGMIIKMPARDWDGYHNKGAYKTMLVRSVYSHVIFCTDQYGRPESYTWAEVALAIRHPGEAFV